MNKISSYLNLIADNLNELKIFGEFKGSVKEEVKLAMDTAKNRTFFQLLELDEEYQKRLAEEKEAHKIYNQMELSEEQKGIVDTLIARSDEAHYDEEINAYMAGMIDSYAVLKVLGITNE